MRLFWLRRQDCSMQGLRRPISVVANGLVTTDVFYIRYRQFGMLHSALMAGDRMQFDQLKRRGCSGAAAAWPPAGRAQQSGDAGGWLPPPLHGRRAQTWGTI